MATLEGRVGGVGWPNTSTGWFHVIRADVDFSALTDTDGVAADPVATDVVKLMNIPAGFILMGFAFNVTEVMGDAGTLDISDTDGGHTFYTGLDLETLQTITGWVTGGPILYTADDILIGTLGGTAATDGTLEIYAYGIRLNSPAILTST